MGLFSRKKEATMGSSVLNAGSDEAQLKEALTGGGTISKEDALSIPAVASAVDTITGKISTIPLKLYKETVKDGKKTVEEVQDSRCNLFNEDTGDTLDGVQFKRAMITDYLLDKGGYAFIKKQGNTVKSIHYVESSAVSVMKNSDPIFKSCTISVQGKNYASYNFVKLLRDTKDGATGSGVLEEISQALKTAYQSLVMQYASTKKGGKKRGFLMTDKVLSKETLTELKKNWESLYSNDGLNSIVLPNGATFQESTDSTFETSVNATRKQLNDEINAIFHIGKTDAETFSSAILPILTAFECAINRVLLLEKEKTDGLFFAFDTKEMQKGDIKSRFEAYKIGIESGIIMPNECRYLENMDELEGLDVINFGLGAVLYDPKTKTYYTPNTDTTAGLNGGDTGGNDE